MPNVVAVFVVAGVLASLVVVRQMLGRLQTAEQELGATCHALLRRIAAMEAQEAS